MKKTIFICVISLMVIHSKIYSQIIPSIYTGYSMGTNIGGEIGIGSEIKYKMISFNAAIGSLLGKLPAHTGAKTRFDYDFGIKLYPYSGAFLGVNYGLIDAKLYTKSGQDLLHFEKIHGFSFTLGYRHSIYKNLYGLGFIGLTSNKKVNYFTLFGNKTFIPRIGLLIGYEFKTKIIMLNRNKLE